MGVVDLKNKQLALIAEMESIEKYPSGKAKQNEMQKVFDQIINIQKQIKNAKANND